MPGWSGKLVYINETEVVNFKHIESIYCCGEQMKQNSISITSSPYDNTNTGSLLKLQLPLDASGPKYTCEWQSITDKAIHGENLNLFKSNSRVIQSSSNEYQCTPMDLGTVILGRISLLKDNARIPVRQMRFGPIEVEDGLHEFYLKEERHHVKMVVNKTRLIDGKLKIVGLPARRNNSYSLKVLLEADKLKFEFEVHGGSEWLSLLKLYPKEETSLGLLIEEHYSLFLQKLKQINVFSHFGYYVKVYFQTRQFRDIFIFEMMELLGLIGPEYRSLASDIIQINVLQQKHNSEHQSQYTPLSSARKMNHGKTSQMLQVNHEPCDEFYNLIYEGEIEEQFVSKRKPSFNMEDAEFLFASIKKSDNSREAMQRIRSLANESHSKEANFKIQKSIEIQGKDQQVRGSGRSISINKDHSESSLKKRRDNSPGFRQTLELIKQATIPRKQKQDELKSAIAKLTSQIQNLMKQNRRLSKENKKLKDENIKWRFKQIKVNFTKTMKSRIHTRSPEKSIIVPSDSKIYQRAENESQRKLRVMLGLGSQKDLQSSRTLSNKSKIFEKQSRSKDINSIRETNASTLASNQFLKDEARPSPSKLGEKKFFPTRNLGIQLQKKAVATRRETEEPDTPSFNPVAESRNYYEQPVKTYESQFFRQYFNQ